MGDLTAGRVVIGEDDVEPLLGVTALESAGIEVDPVNRRLKRPAGTASKAIRAFRAHAALEGGALAVGFSAWPHLKELP